MEEDERADAPGDCTVIVLAIEIACAECGAAPGESCKKAEHVAYGASYSFHLERIIAAKRKMEAPKEDK